MEVSKLKTFNSLNNKDFFDDVFIGMIFIYTTFYTFDKVKKIAKTAGYNIRKYGNHKAKITSKIRKRRIHSYDDDDDDNYSSSSSSFMSTSSIFSGGSSSFGGFGGFGGGSFGGGGGGF